MPGNLSRSYRTGLARFEEGGGPSVRSVLGPKWNGPQMGHSTTVKGVAECAAERFIEHPHRGHFRRIGSVVWLVGRRGHRARYTARATKNPQPGGTAMATSESTGNIIPDMPPWIVDHVAAMRNDQATVPVSRATMIPARMEAPRRPMSFFSAGPVGVSTAARRTASAPVEVGRMRDGTFFSRVHGRTSPVVLGAC